jgi:hypothetical protein
LHEGGNHLDFLIADFMDELGQIVVVGVFFSVLQEFGILDERVFILCGESDPQQCRTPINTNIPMSSGRTGALS